MASSHSVDTSPTYTLNLLSSSTEEFGLHYDRLLWELSFPRTVVTLEKQRKGFIMHHGSHQEYKERVLSIHSRPRSQGRHVSDLGTLTGAPTFSVNLQIEQVLSEYSSTPGQKLPDVTLVSDRAQTPFSLFNYHLISKKEKITFLIMSQEARVTVNLLKEQAE